VVALALPGAGAARYLSGQDLLALCAGHDREDPTLTEEQAVQDLAATATCRGYLMGLADRLEEERAVCVPPETRLGQLLEAVRAYATRSPEDLSRPASGVVESALRRAYPCPPEEPPPRRRGAR
jgi:hypothetical protein